jgi:hypothetical protein
VQVASVLFSSGHKLNCMGGYLRALEVCWKFDSGLLRNDHGLESME